MRHKNNKNTKKKQCQSVNWLRGLIQETVWMQLADHMLLISALLY
jgi:hypothetical protein